MEKVFECYGAPDMVVDDILTYEGFTGVPLVAVEFIISSGKVASITLFSVIP